MSGCIRKKDYRWTYNVKGEKNLKHVMKAVEYYNY